MDPVDDPAAVLRLLERHREVHPYGIADVHQLWASSTWWVDDPAVAGLIVDPAAGIPILYAVAGGPPEPTLRLAARIAPALPRSLLANGAVGLCEHLAEGFDATGRVVSVKLVLADEHGLPPPDDEVVVLDRRDAAELATLYDLDPLAGTYFHPGLLDTGGYVGLREGGQLIAVAGVHVLDPVGRVAALGNVATHPAHRRRGLARRTVATLCHRLRNQVDVIGLNAERGNLAAQALYRALGFVEVADFEEATLTAREPR